jgi:hypothetical protein
VFTDVLGPLAGFLRSNVGRRWNKVYSELRPDLEVRKVTGLHIFDQLKVALVRATAECTPAKEGALAATDDRRSDT